MKPPHGVRCPAAVESVVGESAGQPSGGTDGYRREAESWTRSCGTSAIPRLCTMAANGTFGGGVGYGYDVYFGHGLARDSKVLALIDR